MSKVEREERYQLRSWVEAGNNVHELMLIFITQSSIATTRICEERKHDTQISMLKEQLSTLKEWDMMELAHGCLNYLKKHLSFDYTLSVFTESYPISIDIISALGNCNKMKELIQGASTRTLSEIAMFQSAIQSMEPANQIEFRSYVEKNIVKKIEVDPNTLVRDVSPVPLPESIGAVDIRSTGHLHKCRHGEYANYRMLADFFINELIATLSNHLYRKLLVSKYGEKSLL